ncbi:MAG: hypothetical protein QOI41_1368, partial [Myxococcales bacterium]|nr:hypothetical protein [Myxococcales bacterium]
MKRAAVAASVLLLAVVATGCENTFTGSVVPVPSVHRLPIESEGKAILIAEDPVIESSDPVHLARAKEVGVAGDLREAMTHALALAGFKVVTSPS